MHQPVQDNLEDYFSGKDRMESSRIVQAHLGGCAECRKTVEAFATQNEMIRMLRVEEEVEPIAGFYARVLERIEAQTKTSFWYFFLMPGMGRRFVLAGLAFIALLGAVAVRTDPEGAAPTPMDIIAEHEYPPTPGIDQSHDRDVVLVGLATWSDSGSRVMYLPASTD